MCRLVGARTTFVRAVLLEIVVFGASTGCGRLRYDRLDAGVRELDAPSLTDASRDALDPPADASADVGPVAPPAVVFRSRAIDGAFGGVVAADTICAEDAASAGLPGTFVAYVTTVGGPAPSARRERIVRVAMFPTMV